MRGQGGRPQQGGQGRPGQGGNGRPDNRGEGRFGGNNRGGQRNGGGRRENDAVFTPELTKTSKDSKRERDRENKNKRKTLRNPVQVITDRTRVEEEIFLEFRKLFRNRLLSQNRKRRNQK